MSEDNQETAKSQGEDNNSDIDKGNNNLKDWIQQFLFTLLKPVAKYIPISVIGGSSGFAVFLLKDGKPLLAFLLVVIAILVGIFGRYLEAFITAVAEKYAERGKQDGNSVLTWIDEKDQKIREAIKWKFSGVEDKYLNCLKISDDSLFYLTEGLEQKDTSLSLADVFIELKITGQIGWRKNNEWLSYSNITFDKDTAPQGHLPSGREIRMGINRDVKIEWESFGWGCEGIFSFLFSRL